jgi:hypothetical protein
VILPIPTEIIIDMKKAFDQRHRRCTRVPLIAWYLLQPEHLTRWAKFQVCGWSRDTICQQYLLQQHCVNKNSENKVTGTIVVLTLYNYIILVQNFLLFTSSRPALGSTQPRIQWVPGFLFLGVKRPGREADHSPPTNTEVKKNMDL